MLYVQSRISDLDGILANGAAVLAVAVGLGLLLWGSFALSMLIGGRR